MKKRQRKSHAARIERPPNTHFENLIELRKCNPQAYARLGDGPNTAVETYERERLASVFEQRPGKDRLLDLRDRLPSVFARFSDNTKRMVDEYGEKKRAFEIVVGSMKNS